VSKTRYDVGLGYGLDDRGSFRYKGSDGIFLFTTSSKPALGLTQPPIQWVPGALTPGIKLSGCEACEAHHSPPSSAEVKNAWSCTSTPSIRIHDEVLN
jgi:hypothetical protein